MEVWPLFSRALLLCALLTLLLPAADADEFADGVNAYRSRDFSTARATFEALGARGDARAQFALGLLYENGEGVEKNDAAAADWYRKSAEQGYAKAQYNLGMMHLQGVGVARDERVAREWFERAARQGNPDAVARLLRFAEDGDVSAQYLVGVMYLNGGAVTRDAALASRWLQRAAARGHLDAMFAMGVLTETGKGVERSYAAAANWYHPAASQGHAKAMYNLARLVREGHGQPPDPARAETLFEQAATAGFVPAQLMLGMLFDLGQDWPRDPARAASWYNVAAANGSAEAQLNLGYLLAAGEGVKPDLPEAYARTYAAERLGHPLASDNLRLIGARMSAPEITRARERGETLVNRARALPNVAAN